MSDQESLYIVVTLGNDTTRHNGIESARKHARHLALENPGKEMVVFRAVESAEASINPLILKNYKR